MKPDNVLLDIVRSPDSLEDQLICVITDFGISQIVTDQILKVDRFEVTMVKGMSTSYAAPERILNWRRVMFITGTQTILSWDTFALGIIIYELLTVSKPYK
jgi:serine/threonine protein kinase